MLVLVSNTEVDARRGGAPPLANTTSFSFTKNDFFLFL